jgi:hypothetical protein
MFGTSSKLQYAGCRHSDDDQSAGNSSDQQHHGCWSFTVKPQELHRRLLRILADEDN